MGGLETNKGLLLSFSKQKQFAPFVVIPSLDTLRTQHAQCTHENPRLVIANETRGFLVVYNQQWHLSTDVGSLSGYQAVLYVWPLIMTLLCSLWEERMGILKYGHPPRIDTIQEGYKFQRYLLIFIYFIL